MKHHKVTQKKFSKRPKTSINARKVLRKLFGLVGLFIIVLGAHGLYVHFNKLSFLSDSSKSSGNPLQDIFSFALGNYRALYDVKLFGAIPMLGFLGTITDKVSEWGLQSWFMPVLIGIAGFLVFKYRAKLVDLLYSIFR